MLVKRWSLSCALLCSVPALHISAGRDFQRVEAGTMALLPKDSCLFCHSSLFDD